MSWLTDKLKDKLGGNVGTALDLAANASGTISGLYGAYTTATSALQILGILDSPGNPFIELQNQLAIIQQALDEVLQSLENDRKEAVQIETGITRVTILSDASCVNTAAYNAYWFVKEPSPYNDGQYKEHLASAELALNNFKDNPYYWRRIYLDLLDYSDPWSGALHPPTENGGNWVLDYVETLPAYVAALVNWPIVVFPSDQGFRDAHLLVGTEFLDHIEWLGNRLERVLEGFQPIRAPSAAELSYLIFALDDSRLRLPVLQGNEMFPLTPEQITSTLTRVVPGGLWRMSGYVYGVVETRTSLHALASYPTAELTEGAQYLSIEGWFFPPEQPGLLNVGPAAHVSVSRPDEYDAFYDRFLLRHTLRTRSQGRALARDLGLRKVRDALCQLCAIRHMDPPERPAGWKEYVECSMRGICSALPESMKSGAEAPISMRRLGELIGATVPVALRQMVSP